MTDSPRWHLKHPTELQIREWQGAGVVYDGWTGDTHLLDALGLELVALLAIRPSSLAELATELAEALGPDAQTPLEATLLSLKERQLVACEGDS